jgi:hypothetical protein
MAEFQRHYDKDACKHFIEDVHFVFHCHHYNSLVHRALCKTPYLEGKKLLLEVAAEEFFFILQKICNNKRIKGTATLNVAEELYRYIGFGEIELTNLSATGGTAQSPSSHLATGYLYKWGKQVAPVDDFGLAFAVAAWAVAFAGDVKKCRAVQTRCIACGDSICEFQISR